MPGGLQTARHYSIINNFSVEYAQSSAARIQNRPALLLHLSGQKRCRHIHCLELGGIRHSGAVFGQQTHHADHIACRNDGCGAQHHPGRALAGQDAFFCNALALVQSAAIHQLFQRLADAAVGQLPPAAPKAENREYGGCRFVIELPKQKDEII